jgi:hypothetical protein
MTTPTIEDLLNTPTGQRMAAELESARAVEREAADSKREEGLADALEGLHVAASAYDALRPEALRLLGELAAHVDRLLELRNRLDAARGRVQKLGGGVPADFPTTLMGTPEFKAAVAQAREIATRAGGAL